MSRITKELAGQIARELTRKKLKDVEIAKNDLRDFMQIYALSKIPKPIMECFKKYKEYFNTSSSITFCGNGFNYESYHFKESLPLGNNRIMPDNATAKKVLELKGLADKKEKEYKQLLLEVEITLCNLRTYKNVEKEFPEAFKLLPPPKQGNLSTALIINVSEVRKKLN